MDAGEDNWDENDVVEESDVVDDGDGLTPDDEEPCFPAAAVVVDLDDSGGCAPGATEES